MKIKLFILSLIICCFGLTSFSSAFTIWPRETIYFDQSTTTNLSCNSFCCFLVWNNPLYNSNFSIAYSSSPSVNLLPSMVFNNQPQCFSWDLIVSSDTTYSRSYYWYYFVFDTSWDCPSCQDCSLLSWDLATCQGSLWACIEDNTSLENMNSSLQDQLSQCLANSNACDPIEDEDCYTWAYQLFHLFRQNQWSDFSLPITNNIFLPSWLRAYSDSWSVALAPLSPSDYSLDRESWEILNDLVIKIFYYLAVLLSVMALAYYIKKFLSFTLFPKKD